MDRAYTDVFALSLHDALPISTSSSSPGPGPVRPTPSAPSSRACSRPSPTAATSCSTRSEEHTSELQSRLHLVCRLLLEKKKPGQRMITIRSHPSRDVSVAPTQ